MAGNMAASSNSCSLYLVASLPARQPLSYCSKNLREGFDWLCLGQMANTGPISYVCGDGAQRAFPLSRGQSQSERIGSPEATWVISLKNLIHCITGVYHLVAVYFHKPMYSVPKLLTSLLPCKK